MRIPDEVKLPLDALLHSHTGTPAQTLAVLPELPAGASTVFAADLSRGRYGFISFSKGRDGTQDALKGMNSQLLVQ